LDRDFVCCSVARVLLAALLCFASAAESDSQAASYAKALLDAYSGVFAFDATANEIVWRDGSRLDFGAARPEWTFEQRLDTATLWDQLSIPYSRAWPQSVPDADPGRLRCDAFFKKMYGATAAEVERNMVRVPWPAAGSGKTVRFTKVNGADAALEAVGVELAQLPEDVRRYVAKPNGTFNWRVVAGTPRLSPHSYGIAIDFAMPIDNQYWRWDGPAATRPEVTAPSSAIAYPAAVLHDAAMRRIVEAFERHGFIWGGKWHHYDLMHFEYRPELLFLSGRE